MKKRIIALFCTLALLLQCAPFVSANTYEDIPENTSEERIVDIITKLGIMVGYDDNGVRTFQPYQAVTRAEFVTVMRNCINFWNNAGGGSDDEADALLAEILGFNWNEFAYGADTDLTLLYPEGATEEGEAVKKQLWSDVNEEHWAYGNMRDMAFLGAVKGYPDGTFRPDNTVSYNEAITVILSLCGYGDYAKANGGFPEGYNKLATRFDMNKGISSLGASPLSRMEVATLVYNSFTLTLNTGVDEYGEKNFLNDIVGVYMIEGTVEITDITSIYDSGENSLNTVTVDGKEFKIAEDSNIRDYIGRNVRVFLKKSDELYIMQAFELTGRDEITVIDVEAYEDYEDKTFRYKKNLDSSATNSLKIRAGSVLIKNGKLNDTFTKGDFADLNKGTITVIKKKDLDFDIVILENYTSGYLSSINARNMELIDKLNNNIIKLKSDDEQVKLFYNIFDKEGNALSFEDLKAGAINYIANENYVKLYYSTDSVSGIVSGSNTEKGKKTITLADKEYAISKACLSAGQDARNGLNIKAHLDTFGEIVWIENTDKSLEGYVYFLEARYDSENDTVVLKYFDLVQKAVMETTSTEEVKVTESNNITTMLNSSGLFFNLDGYRGIVRLRVDDTGKVSKIIKPLKDVEGNEDKLHVAFETTTKDTDKNYYGNYQWLNSIFDSKYYIDANTIILRVPEIEEDYDKYAIVPSNTRIQSYAPGQQAYCSLYSFDKTAPFMNIVVLKDLTTSTSKAPVYSGFVTGMVDTINADGEFIKEVSLFSLSTGEITKISARQDEDDDYKSLFEKAEDAYYDKDTNVNAFPDKNPNETYKVSKGDYIRVSVDATGEVDFVQLVYDADGINPAWCNPNGATVSPRPYTCIAAHRSDPDAHQTLLKGTLTDGNGFALSKENGSRGNPIGLSSTGFNATKWANNRFQPVPGGEVGSMITLGFMHSEKDGLYRVTTENLKENWNGKENSNFFWAYYTPRNLNVWIYEDGNFERGMTNDIRSYEQVGSACDKLLMFGYLSTVVILRD